MIVLRKLAGDVFLTTETAETLWRDSFIESLAHRAEDDDLVQLLALWQTLPRERRAKLLEYASEQAELARPDGGLADDPCRADELTRRLGVNPKTLRQLA